MRELTCGSSGHGLGSALLLGEVLLGPLLPRWQGIAGHGQRPAAASGCGPLLPHSCLKPGSAWASLSGRKMPDSIDP